MKNEESAVNPAGKEIDLERWEFRDDLSKAVSQDFKPLTDKLPEPESSKWISDGFMDARTTLPAMSVMWALRNVRKIWELLPAAEQLSNNPASLSKFELIFLQSEIKRLIHENTFQPERSADEFYFREF